MERCSKREKHQADVSPRHIQMPTFRDNDLNLLDYLVYVVLKKFNNSRTNRCYPSMDTISRECGLSRKTVSNSINHLEKERYIEINKDDKVYNYTFSTYKNFEPVSYTFLDNEELTPQEKAYLIAIQRYMHVTGNDGVIKLDLDTIAHKINVSLNTVKRLNRSLKEKGMLDVEEKVTKENGQLCRFQNKTYHLDKFGQSVVTTLMNHEDRLATLEKELNMLKQLYIKDHNLETKIVL